MGAPGPGGTRTDLTRDEALRLATLPEHLHDGRMLTVENARTLARNCWVKMDVKRNPDPTVWDVCVAARHDLWFHYDRDLCTWYYRHGSEAFMVVPDMDKAPEMDQEIVGFIHAWLNWCHMNDNLRYV